MTTTIASCGWSASSSMCLTVAVAIGGAVTIASRFVTCDSCSVAERIAHLREQRELAGIDLHGGDFRSDPLQPERVDQCAHHDAPVRRPMQRVLAVEPIAVAAALTSRGDHAVSAQIGEDALHGALL